MGTDINTNKPLIYTFKTPICNYFYDTNKNVIIRLEDILYNELQTNNIYSENSHSTKKIQYLLDENLLSNKRIQKIEHPSTKYLSDLLDCKLQTITLQVTQQCNLRCSYCVYSGSYITRKHNDKILDFELAKKAVDFLINHSFNSKVLNIGFYGGEPLLEFDLIKKIIVYANEKSHGKKITYNMTTNGTLLTEENVEFLFKNNVDLMISLDGPKEIHDTNRRFSHNNCGTFDVIVKKMEMIKDKFPEYYDKIHFNSVIDPTIDFTCVNEFFSNHDLLKDSFVNTNFISTDNMDMSQEKNKELLKLKYLAKYNYEIFKMFLSKLNRLDECYISKIATSHYESIKITLYTFRKTANSLPNTMHHGGVCIPGVRNLFMNITGDFFPCEKCSETSQPMKIGNVSTGFNIKNIDSLLNIGRITEDDCKNCWAIRLCGICAVGIDSEGALSYELKKQKCNNTKTNTASMLKEYCMLKEFGYNFDEENENLIV